MFGLDGQALGLKIAIELLIETKKKVRKNDRKET